MKLKILQKGQTIIEAVVALSLIIVVLTAISIIVTSSLNNSQFIKNQSIASKYANQGMEYLRYLRNNPPSSATFDSYATSTTKTYCMDQNNQLTPSVTCSTASNYSGVLLIREVTFEENSPNCSGVIASGVAGGTRVTINVKWVSGKCPSNNRFCHKSQLISCFANPSESGAKL